MKFNKFKTETKTLEVADTNTASLGCNIKDDKKDYPPLKANYI